MWVCLEVETEDLEIWQNIDKLLASEFGLTHVVWGVNRANENTPVACKLPSNLFYTETTDSERGLKDRIEPLLKNLRVGYKIMVMDKSWSHQSEDSPKKITPSIKVEEEISSREV